MLFWGRGFGQGDGLGLCGRGSQHDALARANLSGGDQIVGAFVPYGVVPMAAAHEDHRQPVPQRHGGRLPGDPCGVRL